MSWDLILPFLRPIEGLLADPEITDILVNGFAKLDRSRRGEAVQEGSAA